MGVPEIDQAFSTLIDKSVELLHIAEPTTAFSKLIPVKPVKRLELDFKLLCKIATLPRPLYTREYQALFTELKRFEPTVLTFSSIEPGQGVTFTATNIARLWAQEEKEKKILLLEFYNGFSGIEYANPKDEEAQTVNDPQLLEEYLTNSPEDNLYLLSVHSSSIKTDIEEFWSRLTSSFDLIIIDAAPKNFNIMTDTIINRSTGVILISSQKPDPVNVKVFQEEVKELKGRFLGVVMNAMD